MLTTLSLCAVFLFDSFFQVGGFRFLSPESRRIRDKPWLAFSNADTGIKTDAIPGANGLGCDLRGGDGANICAAGNTLGMA